MFAHRRYFNPVILDVVGNFVASLHSREKGREIEKETTVNSDSLLFPEKIRKTISKKWT